MRAVAVIALLAACGGWSKRDTAMEAAFIGASALDWHQTRTIASLCNEQNPVIGACGQNISPDAYFPITIVVHAAIAAALPAGAWRTTWQAVPLGAEVSQTWGNYREQYWAAPDNRPAAPPLIPATAAPGFTRPVRTAP